MPNSAKPFQAQPCYDFHQSYESEWEIFLAQFPEEKALDGEMNAVINICRELDRLIRYLYQEAPEYKTQMDIRYAWYGLKEILTQKTNKYAQPAWGWFVCQLMNMMNSCDDKVVASIWYALGVDYFECTDDGAWLFPRMYEELPEALKARLLRNSISIPWKAKKATYEKMIQNQAHHEMLARALQASCRAYCHGSIRSSEAMALLRVLEISAAMRKEVTDILTSPISVRIKNLVILDGLAKDGLRGFISIQAKSGEPIPTWFPFAELWVGETCLGTFMEDYYLMKWSQLAETYGFVGPDSQSAQEHILAIEVAVNPDWSRGEGVLKPL